MSDTRPPKFLFAALFVVFLVVIFVVLASADDAFEDESSLNRALQPIKIGVSYSFTGPAQRWSDYGRMGTELAAEEINRRGGVNGRPLKLIFEDSRTSPAASVSAYQKLAAVDRVSAVSGDVWSILTNPIIPLTKKYRTVVISPTVMDASVESSSEYFFTMGNRVSSLRGPIRRFFELFPEMKRIAFLCWEDAWGRANLKVWQDEADRAEVEVTDTICQGDHNNDFRIDVTRALAKDPQALFVGMYPERVALRMRESGKRLPIFTTTVVLEAIDVKDYSAELLEGMYFGYWPPNKAFQSAFREKFGKEPILEAHNHYEVIQAIARGLEQNEHNLPAGLKNLSYQGVSGPIDFSKAPFVNRSSAALMRTTANYGFEQVE